jgi:glycerol-3-phosphate acyltransferase PlsY
MLVPKSVLCMIGILSWSSQSSVMFRWDRWLRRLLCRFLHGRSTSPASESLILMLATSALIIWKHRQNLSRIAAGTEPKLGARAR